MKLSIIIPVYRGKEILRDLFRRIKDTLFGNYEYEVLFVCDGCDSSSLRIVKELKQENPSIIKVFPLANNYGQHRALQFGFGKAVGDFVITMDEDLQHDPADVIKLIEKQKESNYDIVYGKFNNSQQQGIRNRISFVLRKILKNFIPTLYDNYSPYRLIKQKIAIRISTMVCPITFIDDFLSRVTQSIAYENINHHKRAKGKSSYTFMKLFKHGIYILLAYSKLIPLLIVSSVVIEITAAVIFALSVISSESFINGLFSNISIIAIMGIGMILLIFSLIGSFINHRNTIINTRVVKLLNNDPI